MLRGTENVDMTFEEERYDRASETFPLKSVV